MSDLDRFFTRVSETVDAELDRLIPKREIGAARLYDAVRWSVFAGGKRFRPALVFAIGEMFGAEASKLVATAAAIEMIHTYSLIHDDLPAMDDDELRRGRATCHVKFDEATAILAGDVLQSLAFRAIADDASLDAEIRLQLVSELADAAEKMVAGQQLDIDGEGRRIELAELEEIHRNKTGAMIVASVRAGAIVGGATRDELGAVTDYARNLGLLFQITDDILDVTQTTETLGKTAGKDVASEKSTYPSLVGLDDAIELARRTRADAASAIAGLGREITILTAIADFILNRKS